MSEKQPTPPAEAPATAATFEHATARLARIVDELEKGDIPLERSLALFEEGIRLAREAEARIASAEKRVEELLAMDPTGKPVMRPLAIQTEDDP
jgi:exodeoxyribonuclease VII small subunit